MSEVPFVPTPKKVVRRMLELAEVTPEERVYDLGAGDGRIPIEAAKVFHAVGIGVEIHPVRYGLFRKNVEKEGLSGKVLTLKDDFFKVDLKRADIVTLYLLSKTNAMLRPKLEAEIKPTTRVVAHDFPVPGWKPYAVEQVVVDGKLHKIYLYVPGRSFKVR